MIITRHIIISVTFILFICNLNAQTFKNTLEVTGGANYSDVNYGNEFLEAFLPQSNYLSSQSGGDGDFGYYLGIGTSFKVSNHFLASANIDYSRFRYKIDGSVSNLRPTVTRPPSSEIPIEAKGVVKYSLINIQTSLSYSFNNDVQKGFFTSLLLSYMIHLNTAWNLNVKYEDSGMGTVNDLSMVNQPKFNNLWFVGLGIGYHFPLKNNLTLSPLVNYKYGLNSIVDNNLEPIVIDAGINLKWWF